MSNTIVRLKLPRVFRGQVDLTPALLFLGYQLRDAVNVYPPRKPGMRVRWKSRRQRKYVLAKVQLPYRRTGWLAKQWFVTPTSSARVVVRNKARYAAFVVGKAQQPFHKDRGWRRADEEASKLVYNRAVMREFSRIIERELKR
jgi:hypothetical protein